MLSNSVRIAAGLGQVAVFRKERTDAFDPLEVGVRGDACLRCYASGPQLCSQGCDSWPGPHHLLFHPGLKKMLPLSRSTE
jgi:hypothetical protein